MPERGGVTTRSLWCRLVAPIGDSVWYVLGLIGRHLQGKLPLGVSFWFLWLGATEALRRLLFWLADRLGEASTLSFQVENFMQGAIYLVAFLIFLAGAVGTWRSAARSGTTTADWLMQNLTRLLILSLVCGVVYRASQDEGPYGAFLEKMHLAAGELPSDYPDVEVSEDGRELRIEGSLGNGSSSLVTNALRRSPELRTVVLSSPGGSIHDALEIADSIRARELKTRVERRCNSACVLLLLAGTDRTAEKGSRIGLHQASRRGTREVSPRGNDTLRRAYLERGVGAGLIERMLKVPPASMWYPSSKELLGAGILTHHAYLHPMTEASVEDAPAVSPDTGFDDRPAWMSRW